MASAAISPRTISIPASWRGAPTASAPTRTFCSIRTKRSTAQPSSRWVRIPVSRPGTQDEWKLGGGTTWGWYTYDPQLNLVYYGSGNPGTWNPTQRPGDNKWSTTLFARNPDTGVAAWAYQMTPHDAWDYDGINESVLTDSVVDGNTVPTLTHFDRNGFAYVLDRRNGKLLRANKFDPSTNWAKEIDLKTGRPVLNPDKMTKEDVNVKDICPAAQGAKNHQPASYDPKTKLFYVGTNHICMDYQAFSVKYQRRFPVCGRHSEHVPRRSRQHARPAHRL